ncbi:hypothetical protein [Bradyrhizobium septentrionale]|uniref:Uncharacterized protein n=1 Tax=Bradyrhizobium septentrionale TaxID=1404411 RepID=A0A974A423_9BRAD|nr:hypothetical protein [Bradyrhizobium septentrionale]UGY15640.1 hypothetical protein HAP48_0045220 [Bradyrhizobium septentrionale]UGY24215.1 hypothetical protein HU675_0040860 [Bradyrhizobium septentrionale]
MTSRGNGIDGCGRGTRLLPLLALAAFLIALIPASVSAQFFSDRPPPIPPASVPEVAPSGPALNLAPPSGAGSGPVLPGPLTQPTIVQPSIATTPPAALPPAGAAPTAGQAVLSLTARYGKDLPVINAGLVWRVFADKPDDNGTYKLIREERGATPNLVLPPGNYVVHVALGLVSAVRAVSLKSETDREFFVLPAGGLRIEGRVGSSKIPANQISFAIYKGSQFDGSDRGALVPNVAAGDVALLPEGTYYIISNYGDANSVVRSDIRVAAGKLTDVTVTHRAAVITLKLVSEKGGEALANTAWSVITPGGDVIKESIGAFPRVVLSEGEYRAIAKNEGKVFERPFNVVNGVDGEVEVVAR